MNTNSMPMTISVQVCVFTLIGWFCLSTSLLLHAEEVKHPNYAVQVQSGIAYFDGFELDIYLPEGNGPFPIALVLHGASGGKASMVSLAQVVAEQGYIVFNAEWLSRVRPLSVTALERSMEAAACALRFAPAHAVEYGGDGQPLTVIGSSAGAVSGALITLGADEFGDACEAIGPVPEVALFIGFEGGYFNIAEGADGFAKMIEEKPALAQRMNPLHYLTESPNLRVVLLLGDQFKRAAPVTQKFYEALRGANIQAEIRHLAGPHKASTMMPGVLAILEEESSR